MTRTEPGLFDHATVTKIERPVLFVDGGCRGNGQRDLRKRQMVWVVTDDYGAVLVEATAHGGSNNIAELIAVRDAMRWCAAKRIAAVTIRTDSQNTIKWVESASVGDSINDRARVLAVKAEIARLRQYVDLELMWVPRDQNAAGHYLEARSGS